MSTGMENNEHLNRIVCAAIRGKDGTVLLGVRHYSKDMHEQINARFDGEQFKDCRGDDQGFIDKFGRYHTREEAYKIALAAGQIWRPRACTEEKLFSEALY